MWTELGRALAGLWRGLMDSIPTKSNQQISDEHRAKVERERAANDRLIKEKFGD